MNLYGGWIDFYKEDWNDLLLQTHQRLNIDSLYIWNNMNGLGMLSRFFFFHHNQMMPRGSIRHTDLSPS